jgi:hypothetical protein
VSDHRNVAALGFERRLLGDVVEIVAVPSLTEYGGEDVSFPAGDAEDSGELWFDNEESGIWRWTAILAGKGIDETLPGSETAHDPLLGPCGVAVIHEASYVRPRRSLASTGRLPHEYDVEPSGMLRAVCESVRSGTDRVPERGEEIEKDRNGIRFRVRFEEFDDLAGEPGERGTGKARSGRH